METNGQTDERMDPIALSSSLMLLVIRKITRNWLLETVQSLRGLLLCLVWAAGYKNRATASPDFSFFVLLICFIVYLCSRCMFALVVLDLVSSVLAKRLAVKNVKSPNHTTNNMLELSTFGTFYPKM